jgi:hypothetical protein
LHLEIANSLEVKMNRVSWHFAAVLMLSSALALGAGTAFAQSSGSTGGGSSSGGSAGSVGRTGGAGAGSPGLSTAPRIGGTGSGASGTNDPRSLSNQPATSVSPGSTAPGTYSPGSTTPAPAGTSTPSGTGYPSGPALEAARQRSLQAPAGTAIPPSAAGVGADRSSTSEVGGDSATEPETPGLPNQAQSNRDTVGNPERLAGGGRSNREGATGATMQECEAAWDAETHMSKDTWRETCRRTLTDLRR